MIHLEQVSFRYEGCSENTLENVSLSVARGECVVLTGASGCGKTSITRLLNALIPHFYSGELKGRVTISGKDTASCAPHTLSPVVGSVFQNPRTQFFSTDTDSELVFGMENCGIPYGEMQKRYRTTVSALHLEPLSGRNIFALSGGEKQRIAFGSIFALGPEIYILDEPSANLDAAATQRLRELLLFLKKQGKTIVIAEHRLYYLQDVADRILFMKNGEISQDFSAAEFAGLPTTVRNAQGLPAFTAHTLAHMPAAAPAKTAVLELRGLSAAYPQSQDIFQDVNFTLSAGEIAGIAGPNGWGKTTLAHTICGLHHEKSGEIFFNGKRVKAKNRNRHAYLVMQDPNYQLFCDSVLAELRLSASGKPPEEDKITAILQALDLTCVQNQHPLSLSGGQKQRLSIALAALNPAEILIFDEPTSGLDYANMRRVSGMLRMLAAQGKSILVISHDNAFLSEACTRIIFLQKNKNTYYESEETNYVPKHICS